MCYSNSLTSKNVDLSKKYKKEIPSEIADEPLFHASGFSFPEWRIITNKPEISVMSWGLIPYWFSGDNIGDIASKTLNARSET
ncbi:MAG: SOS response-associated peptidase, partial [Bacteroidota bacterium]